LRRLVKLAYPEHDKTEDLAIDQFIKGLENFQLQKRVQFSHPPSLESAIAIAIEYEAFVGSTTSIEIRKPKEPQAEVAINALKKGDNYRAHREENKDLTEFKKSIMDCFQELNKRIDELSKSVPVKCTRCSRYGHNSSDCKTPFCNKCQTMGHYTNNCRTHNNSNSKTDHSQQSRTKNTGGDNSTLNTKGQESGS